MYLALNVLSSRELSLYGYLSTYSKNNPATINKAKLATAMNCSLRTLLRYLSTLKDNGFIEILGCTYRSNLSFITYIEAKQELINLNKFTCVFSYPYRTPDCYTIRNCPYLQTCEKSRVQGRLVFQTDSIVQFENTKEEINLYKEIIDSNGKVFDKLIGEVTKYNGLKEYESFNWNTYTDKEDK